MDTRLAFLRTVRPFDLLPPEVLEEVAALLQEVTHPREAVIYRQGETKLRGVDLIIEGAYDTFFYDGQQARRLPEVYGPGECYGGVSVLLNKKHWAVASASARASCCLPIGRPNCRWYKSARRRYCWRTGCQKRPVRRMVQKVGKPSSALSSPER